MNISIRQAVLSDLDDLVPLFDSYRQFYGYDSNLNGAREFLLDRFNHGESALFIAQSSEQGNETALGFAQLYPSFSSASLARTFILNDLFVKENSRNQGVGKRLLGAAVDYAKSLSATRLTLTTASTNTAAQDLYTACGWTRDEQFIVYHYTL